MFAGIIRPLEERDYEEVENIFDPYWTDDFRLHLSQRIASHDFKWIVAEENGEIVGVAASRKAPEHMMQYAKTDKVIEFYVAAAKYKGKGIATALRNLRIEEARAEGYKEAVFFSGEQHQDSWSFHDASNFRRAGEMTAPNGEKGYVWLMEL